VRAAWRRAAKALIATIFRERSEVMDKAEEIAVGGGVISGGTDTLRRKGSVDAAAIEF